MKITHSFIIGALFFLVSCSFTEKMKGQNQKPTKHSFELTQRENESSIRAIEALDEMTMWYGGSKGHYGFTIDGGKSWHVDSLQHENVVDMEFRSIAVVGNAVFLLNVGSPAILYKSNNYGKDWTIVYEEHHPDVFYDAIAFWNANEGIAMGDPIDGCLSVVVTRDGGENWTKISCDQLPASYEGEAAFAASNTNIAISGNHTWIVSGGKKARVFYSPDKAETWEVYETPISQGGQMTGIFSVDFWDERNGIIWGGDWENQGLNTKNKAITTDGGKSWELIAEGQDPGYRSCVQYKPNAEGQELIAAGIPGMSYSYDGGQSWELLDSSSFYTARFSPSGRVIWLAGRQKIGRIELK